MKWISVSVLVVSLLSLEHEAASGQDEPSGSLVVRSDREPLEPNKEVMSDKGYLNIPTPTLGGMQFWTDFAWNDGWRIQQNAMTEHWRLLSPKNVRYAWGSFAACEAALKERVSADRPAETRVVVLVHGLMRSSQSMAKMGAAIEEAGIGRSVNFEYASTRRGIAEHAKALRHWIETLPGQPQVDFVCHSMGNIVVRHLMADLQRDGDPQGTLNRIGKFVMLGPPNQGAEIAKQLSKLGLFEIVTGKGGMELGPAWDQFQQQLTIPPCPFIIVAGDISKSWLKNPIVDGPSDLVVRIEEAQLDGCVHFHQVPVLHSFLMNDEAVQKLTIEFLAGT
jgi:pimeloyl-ACP methyl ester carboxylesterase